MVIIRSFSFMNKKHMIFWIFLAFLTMETSGQSNFDVIDKYAQSVPNSIKNDISDITHYIIKPCTTDLEKLRAIFIWIVTHISYDKAADSGTNSIAHDLDTILRYQKTICIGYAKLLQKMCQTAGLESEIISGYCHNNPTSKNITDSPDHAWNAVKLNDEWYLLDATWSASLWKSKPKKKINPEVDYYFLPKAATFLETHLPAQPLWQLVSNPIDMNIFISQPDSIIYYVENSSDPYSYTDSIRAFLKLAPSLKKIKEGLSSWQFHPTEKNLNLYMAALMDRAGELTDSLEYIQKSGPIESLLSAQRDLLELCRYTASLGNLLTWQKELYAEAIINHIVALHRSANGRPDMELKTELLFLLEEARTVLRSSEETYYTRNALELLSEYQGIIGQN